MVLILGSAINGNLGFSGDKNEQKTDFWNRAFAGPFQRRLFQRTGKLRWRLPVQPRSLQLALLRLAFALMVQLPLRLKRRGQSDGERNGQIGSNQSGRIFPEFDHSVTDGLAVCSLNLLTTLPSGIHRLRSPMEQGVR